MRVSSIVTSICRLRAPTSVAWPTPATVVSCRTTLWSASVVRAGTSSDVELIATDRTGSAAGSNLDMTGFLASSGKFASMAAILSRTSCAAAELCTSSLNFATTTDRPS
ncbi:hypothetical protein D3C87_851240 [compost metagenome]